MEAKQNAPQKTAAPQQSLAKKYGLYVALIVMVLIALMPTPQGLSPAGQNVIAIMAFAVIVWMTTAISYAVSAGMIITLIALLVGFFPNEAGKVIGSSAALGMGLKGYSSTAFLLVAAALFLAAAMTKTRLDRRIALLILSKIGTTPNRVLAGTIIVGFVLALFVPSTTARVACIVPIVLGIIDAFGVSRKSKFAALLMITTSQIASVWNIGIKTAAAQNMVAVNFVRSILGQDITWMEWFIAAAPYAIIMSVIMYYLMKYLFPLEVGAIPGGKQTIDKMLAEMGPISAGETKLMVISLCLLFLWSTEKVLHPFDTSTTTMVAICILMLPKIGVMSWNEIVKDIDWGSIVMFGAGISLGSALLSTKAATWLANWIVTTFALADATTIMVLTIMAVFLIVIHLGFASATGLASSIIPVVIAVLQQLKAPNVNIVGMTMLLQYIVCFGFILPVNSPQGMLAYGSNTFTSPEYVRSGIPLTIINFALFMVFAFTYWRWLGLV